MSEGLAKVQLGCSSWHPSVPAYLQPRDTCLGVADQEL